MHSGTFKWITYIYEPFKKFQCIQLHTSQKQANETQIKEKFSLKTKDKWINHVILNCVNLFLWKAFSNCIIFWKKKWEFKRTSRCFIAFRLKAKMSISLRSRLLFFYIAEATWHYKQIWAWNKVEMYHKNNKNIEQFLKLFAKSFII